MSAYIVSRQTIDYLLRSALELGRGRGPGQCFPFTWHWRGSRYQLHREDPRGSGLWTPDKLGRELWGENLKSVEARYPDCVGKPENRPGPVGEVLEEYTFALRKFASASPDPVWTLKQIRCLQYQSCEHEGWHESMAHAVLESLTSFAISYLDGYEDAPWGIE